MSTGAALWVATRPRALVKCCPVYSGHVSVFVGIRHALEAGYGTVDHVDGYVEGLVPDTLGLDPESNGFFGVDWVPYTDMGLLDGLIQKTLDNNVAIVPTQSLFDRWISTKSADQSQLEKVEGKLFEWPNF